MKTYKIMITFSSDPKEFWSGNISRYYFAYKRGNRVGLSSNSNAKQYLNRGSAINMCDKLHEINPTALIEVMKYDINQGVETEYRQLPNNTEY